MNESGWVNTKDKFLKKIRKMKAKREQTDITIKKS